MTRSILPAASCRKGCKKIQQALTKVMISACREFLTKAYVCNEKDDEVLAAALESSLDIWGPASETAYIRRLDTEGALLVRSFYYYGIFRVLREWTRQEMGKKPEEVADILYKILTSRAGLEYSAPGERS